jgi:hypothetical protein
MGYNYQQGAVKLLVYHFLTMHSLSLKGFLVSEYALVVLLISLFLQISGLPFVKPRKVSKEQRMSVTEKVSGNCPTKKP